MPELDQIEGRSLLSIDVEALSDHVETLVRCYLKAEKGSEIPIILDRLIGNIAHPSWRAKIAYHKAIQCLLRHDRKMAIEELSKAGPITSKSADIDLLQIHFDLFGEHMGLTEKLRFIDSILELTCSRADRLQYGGARAFQFLMAGDEAEGLEGLLEVIRQGREMEAEHPFCITHEIWFCKALEGIGIFKREPKHFDEIVRRLEHRLSDMELSAELRGQLGRCVGDALRYSGKFGPAISVYQVAYEQVPDGVLIAFQAECFLRLGDSEEALKVLSTVDSSKFDDSQFADYALTYFFVALDNEDHETLVTALDLLKRAKTPAPYFEKMRLSNIIKTQEAITALAERKPIPKATGLSGWLRNVSRYIQLQPNIAGIGFNLNNAIDDIAERIDEKRVRQVQSPHIKEGP